jgi:putative ABC transport system permease protein
VKRVRAVPGVAAVATSMTVDPVQIKVSGTEQAMSVYLVDARQLRAAQAGVQGAAPIPASVVESDPLDHVVISTDLATQLGQLPAGSLSVDQHRLTVAGAAPSAAGLGRSVTWILADRALSRYFTDADYDPDTLLISLSPGTGPASAAAAVSAAVAGEGTVVSPDQVSATLLNSPAIGGVRTIVLTVLVGMAVLSGLAVTLLSVGTASARRRMLAVLGILGLPSASARRLVGWELVPLCLAAFLGGGAVGAGLSRIVVYAIDLRPFTGGTAAPAVATGGSVLAALVGGFAVAVGVATLIGSAVAGRASAAVVMRFGDT